uniref:Uncharacterized protein n=1 Tax=viral metagenome TaxID=1070528 RepID=A0A6C0H665_9ZZZZ
MKKIIIKPNNFGLEFQKCIHNDENTKYYINGTKIIFEKKINICYKCFPIQSFEYYYLIKNEYCNNIKNNFCENIDITYYNQK